MAKRTRQKSSSYNGKRRKTTVKTTTVKTYKKSGKKSFRKKGKGPCKGISKQSKKCIKHIVEKQLSVRKNTGFLQKRFAGELLGIQNDDTQNVVGGVLLTIIFNSGDAHDEAVMTTAVLPFPPDLTYIKIGRDLDFFTPRKLLDAASILFNGKRNYMNGHDEDYTGIMNFKYRDLKLFVKHASASLFIKNDSGQKTHFSVFVGTHKGSSDDSLFNDFVKAVENANHVGFLPTANLGIVGINPKHFPSIKGNWKLKEHKFTLGEGQQKTISMGSINNKWINFSKLVDDGKLFNQESFSTSAIVMYHAEINRNYRELVVNPPSAAENIVGRYKGNDAARYGLNIEILENFTLEAPEITVDEYNKDAFSYYHWRQGRLAGTVPSFVTAYHPGAIRDHPNVPV